MVLRKALFKALFLSLLLLPFSVWAETADDYAHRGAQKYIFGDMAAAKSEVAKGLAKFPRDKELQEMAKLFQDRKGGGGKSNQQQQQQQNGGSQDQQNSNQQPQNNQNNSGKDQQQSQDQRSQGQQKSEQQKSQNSGQSPSPSPSRDENSPKQDQKGKGEQSPSPEPGSTPPAPSASPPPGEGEGKGEGGEPSATPSESPEKRIAGQLKEASEPNSQKQDKTGEIADAEAEKEGKMSERQALALLESMKDEEAKVRLDERRAARHVYKDW